MTSSERNDAPRLSAPAPRIGALVLFALALAVYAPSLANGLTNWDDPRYVEGNPFAIHGLAGIPAAWANSWEHAWYPLTHTVYCVIQAFAGPSAFAHHLVLVVLAAAAIACAPAALGALGVPHAIGWWAALIWLAQPARVESIAWVSSLKDVVSLLGVLGAFAAWAQGRRRIAAVAFTAAVLGKTTVFPLAFVFVWLEMQRADVRTIERAITRTAIVWLPALLCGLIAARLHAFAADPGFRTVPGGSLPLAIPSVLWLPWWYAGRVFLGWHPQAVYAFEPVRWFDLRLAVALVLWAAALRWAIRAQLAARKVRVGLLLVFVLAYAPVTGLVPLAFQVADRYALLPSLVLAAAGLLAIDRLLRRFPAQRPMLASAALALVAAAYLPGNFARQAEWRDSITLWEADRERAPDEPAVRINLAGAYGAASRWSDAIGELREIRARRLPYANLARDTFFAHAALAGMDPGQVISWSQQIAASGGDLRVALRAGSAALAAGHIPVAEAMAELAQDKAPAEATRLRQLVAQARARGVGHAPGAPAQAADNR